MNEIRRGSRTRFDRSERTIILGALGAVALVAAALIAFFLVTRQAATSRAFDTPPRNLDFWAIYPNGQVRFATLYFPDDSVVAEDSDETVTAAGPLAPSESAILSTTIIGGEEDLIEILPGPGENSALVYPLATLKRNAGEPYGIDVLTNSSPYLTEGVDVAGLDPEADPLPPNAKILSLGIGEVGQGYRQVVVAIALPKGSRVISTGTVEDGEVIPYRQVNIGGWTVYYFETTNAVITDAIRMQFVLDNRTPDDLDVLEVNAKR
jgi:hypothetical protein